MYKSHRSPIQYFQVLGLAVALCRCWCSTESWQIDIMTDIPLNKKFLERGQYSVNLLLLLQNQFWRVFLLRIVNWHFFVLLIVQTYTHCRRCKHGLRSSARWLCISCPNRLQAPHPRPPIILPLSWAEISVIIILAFCMKRSSFTMQGSHLNEQKT